MQLTEAADAKLSRRERERLRRRHEILRAAQAVFAEKGYANATLDEIAQRAEFGKGTIYNYFEGGKEGILFASFDAIYDDFTALIDATFTPALIAQSADSDEGFRGLLRAFIESCFRFLQEREELFMILMKEAHRMALSDDPERAAHFRRHHEQMIRALAEPLQASIEAGVLKPLDAHAVAHMVMGNIQGLQMHLCLAECAGDELDAAGLTTPEAAASFLTTMLFDGLKAEDAPLS